MPAKKTKKGKQPEPEPEPENDVPIVIEYPDMPQPYCPSNGGFVFGQFEYPIDRCEADPWKALPIKQLKYAQKLEQMHLGKMGITELSSQFNKFVSLKALYLNSNKISQLSHLRKLTSIRILDISKNRLKSLRGIEHMKALEYLNASYNFIHETKFHETMSIIRKFKFLEYLDLQHNFISNIFGIREIFLTNCKSILIFNQLHITEKEETLYRSDVGSSFIDGKTVSFGKTFNPALDTTTTCTFEFDKLDEIVSDKAKLIESKRKQRETAKVKQKYAITGFPDPNSNFFEKASKCPGFVHKDSRQQIEHKTWLKFNVQESIYNKFKETSDLDKKEYKTADIVSMIEGQSFSNIYCLTEQGKAALLHQIKPQTPDTHGTEETNTKTTSSNSKMTEAKFSKKDLITLLSSFEWELKPETQLNQNAEKLYQESLTMLARAKNVDNVTPELQSKIFATFLKAQKLHQKQNDLSKYKTTTDKDFQLETHISNCFDDIDTIKENQIKFSNKQNIKKSKKSKNSKPNKIIKKDYIKMFNYDQKSLTQVLQSANRKPIKGVKSPYFKTTLWF